MPPLNFINFFNYSYVAKQKIALAARSLLGYSYIRIYLASIGALLSVNWISAYYIHASSKDSPIIALHYNIDFGVNLIGSAGQIYAMPLLASAISLANLTLLIFFYKKNRFLSHIFSAASLFVNIIISISIFLIYLINFR